MIMEADCRAMALIVSLVQSVGTGLLKISNGENLSGLYRRKRRESATSRLVKDEPGCDSSI